MLRRAAILGVLALGLTCGLAQADDGVGGTFLGGTCNGQVDSNCHYCSYQGSPIGEPTSYCYSGTDGFYWSGCAVWTDGVCRARAVSISCRPLCASPTD